MGEDVRIPTETEANDKAGKRLAGPLFAAAVLVILLLAIIFVPRMYPQDGRQTSGQQIPPAREAGVKAQPLGDADPAQEVPGPAGTADVQAPGKVIPPGTTTVPPAPPGTGNLVGTGAQGLRPPAPGKGEIETTITPMVGASPHSDTNLNPSIYTLILSDKPERYEGARVAVYRGTVQYVIPSRSFAVGPSKQSYMWVIFPSDAPAVQRQGWTSLVQPGKRVYVDGVLSEVPPIQEASRLFGTYGTPYRIGRSRLYIRARAVESFRP